MQLIGIREEFVELVRDLNGLVQIAQKFVFLFIFEKIAEENLQQSNK